MIIFYRVKLVRVRGGSYKFRALKLNMGNFAWRSEQTTRKTRIIDVAYNAANNEYVRTKTITKNAIVLIDASPFKLWYKSYYNIDLSSGESETLEFSDKLDADKKAEIEERQKTQKLPKNIEKQFGNNKILACITSKPGQVGRADGYILEGDELQFYLKKISEKKKSKQKD